MLWIVNDLDAMPRAELVESDTREAAITAATLSGRFEAGHRLAARQIDMTMRSTAFEVECDHLLRSITAYREEAAYLRGAGFEESATVADEKAQVLRARWMDARRRIRSAFPVDEPPPYRLPRGISAIKAASPTGDAPVTG